MVREMQCNGLVDRRSYFRKGLCVKLALVVCPDSSLNAKFRNNENYNDLNSEYLVVDQLFIRFIFTECVEEADHIGVLRLGLISFPLYKWKTYFLKCHKERFVTWVTTLQQLANIPAQICYRCHRNRGQGCESWSSMRQTT